MATNHWTEADYINLLRDLVTIEDDDCRFDHHGGCQAHGYLTLEPGEVCPHAEAKQLIAEFDAAHPEEPPKGSKEEPHG